jgi:hypothetical protein
VNGARRASLAAAFLAFLSCMTRPEVAAACASCACGDTTLTIVGAEKPYAGRLRFSMLFQSRSVANGVPDVSQVKSQEQRLTTSLAYTPLSWLSLSLSVPVVWRQAQLVDLSEASSGSVGDIEIASQFYLYRDQAFDTRHLMGARLGLRMPTAPTALGPDGTPLIVEAQPGTGSFDPLAGLFYGYYTRPWSFYASSTVYVPTQGRQDYRFGTALLSTVSAQVQPWIFLGFRLGFDTRWDTPLVEANGDLDPHSGGFVGFVSPEILLSPGTDWLVQLTTRVPVVQAVRGEQSEGWMFLLGLIYDA